ncbi:hypothetical protein ACOJBM_41230 [Rhizobium beringeri]
MRLQRERSLTLLYISHDLAVVSSLCQRVYVFKAGRIVEQGVAWQVLSTPQDPYTQALVGSLAPAAVGPDNSPFATGSDPCALMSMRPMMEPASPTCWRKARSRQRELGRCVEQAVAAVNPALNAVIELYPDALEILPEG